AQVRDVFASIEKTLKAQGGTLKDMVTMTVFITDARNGDRFVAIRKEIFKECFPASALITVSGLAVPGLPVEVQGIAVVGGQDEVSRTRQEVHGLVVRLIANPLVSGILALLFPGSRLPIRIQGAAGMNNSDARLIRQQAGSICGQKRILHIAEMTQYANFQT